MAIQFGRTLVQVPWKQSTNSWPRIPDCCAPMWNAKRSSAAPSRRTATSSGSRKNKGQTLAGCPFAHPRRKEEEEDPTSAATQQIYHSFVICLQWLSRVKDFCKFCKDGGCPSRDGCFCQGGCGWQPVSCGARAWIVARARQPATGGPRIQAPRTPPKSHDAQAGSDRRGQPLLR